LICVVQECLKYGTTNKWSDTKDVKEGYQCKFGKIIEIEKEEVTKAAEEIEQLPPAQPPTEEPAEESTALTESIWMQSKEILLDLTWLWFTLLIITILSTAYFFLKKRKE
jgi:hypothetical protein